MLSLHLMVILQPTSVATVFFVSLIASVIKLEDHDIAAHGKPGSGPRHLVYAPNGEM